MNNPAADVQHQDGDGANPGAQADPLAGPAAPAESEADEDEEGNEREDQAGAAAVPAAGAMPPALPAAVAPAAAVMPAIALIWGVKIAEIISDLGLEEVFDEYGIVLASFFGVSKVTLSLVQFHYIQVATSVDAAGNVLTTKTVGLGASRGADRAEALRQWVLELARTPAAAGVKTGLFAICSALMAVLDSADKLDQVSAPSAGAGDPADAARNSSPSSNTRAAVARAVAAEKAKRGMYEMSSEELNERLKTGENRFGAKAPSRDTIAHEYQLKALYEEIVEQGVVPSRDDTQPIAMKALGGESGLRAASAGKNKAVLAEATTCPTEARHRFGLFVDSIAVVVCHEPDGEEIHQGAQMLGNALRRSFNLKTYEQVASAMAAAMGKARRARNGYQSDRVSIGAAFRLGGEVIYERNDAAATTNLKRTTDEANAPAAATEATTGMTKAEMIAAIDWAVKSKGTDKGASTVGKMMTHDGKKVGPFKRMKGGNPDCPVACPHDQHDKDRSWCEYHHGDK